MLKFFFFRENSIIFIALFIFTSCQQVQEVPFPEELAGYSQPQIFPLEFTDPGALHWDTTGKGTITPTVFHLDFKKLKGMDYDSGGFKPLPYPVTQSSFNVEALPSRALNPDALPAHPLRIKTTTLPLPASSVKLQRPERINAATMDLKIWQQVTQLNAVIYGMAKDMAGFIWLATENGIYRFDGTMLTNMIPGVFCYNLCFDKNGNLWYADGGDRKQAAFVKVDFEKKALIKYFTDLSITSFTNIIAGNDGTIWKSGSAASPPALICPEKKLYYTFDSKAGFNSSRYFLVAADTENRAWIGSFSGIEIIDPDANKIIHIGRENGLSTDTIFALTTGPDGRIWAAGSNSADAIDIKSGKINHYRLGDSDNNQKTYSLLIDKAGQLWVGRKNDISIINVNDNTLRHIDKTAGILYNDNVFDFLESNTGQILVTGFSGRSAVYTIEQYGKTVFPFRNTAILSSTEDSNGNLWVGTENELFVVDAARKTYWRLAENNGLASPFIQSVTEQNGKVVVTTNGGYNIYNPPKDEWLRVSRKEGWQTDSIFSWMEDHKGNAWVTSISAGISRYDRSSGNVLRLDSKGGLNGNLVLQAFTVPGNNDIWMATVEGGPNIIDPENNTIRFIKNVPGLDSVGFKGISIDSRGRLWVTGTPGYGLYMIDLSGKKVARFTTKEGLSSNSTNSVHEYKGKMLVCTDQNVNIITPPELSSSHHWEIGLLRHSEGLKKSTISFVSDALTKSGDYLWGDNGLGIIYGIEPDTSVSTGYITGIRIMGKDIVFADRKEMADTAQQKNNISLSAGGYTEKGDFKWDSLRGPYHLPVNLSLPDDQNIIRFSFSEISAGRQDDLEFAYTLEGIDKKWTLTKDLQTETYLNLSPGDYIFKVASRWQNGKWNTPAIFPFTIRPPWYNTWWAYLIYFVAALSLLRLYIILRSRKLTRENKLLEEKVNLRTEELQQSYNNVEKLEEIGKKITSSLSVERIIGTVYNNVNSLMDASVFGIGIYNEGFKRIDFPATYENGHLLPFYFNDIDDKNRLSTICFNEGKEIVMGNIGREHKDYIQQIPVPIAGDQAVSLIYLPLVSKGKKLGVITVQSFRQNAYSDYHLFMLRNIAIYAAIALENAKSYEDLKSTQAQLIQSEKMASLGELTAGIAHEIQNPLNFINNFSEVNNELIEELKQEWLKANEERDRTLEDELFTDIIVNNEKIAFHGKRADGIVKGMLQHSRKSSGTKEPTDINALCDEYLRLSYHGLRAKDKGFNAEFKTNLDESIGKVNLVPQDIGRVLLNLFNNAFYAVNERRKDEGERFKALVSVNTLKLHNSYPENGSIEIKVIDNGNGIPKNIIDKIFQPFFTTKPVGNGTGLGLSLSYDIIKAHGGKLKVESKEKEGTIFVIELPVL